MKGVSVNVIFDAIYDAYGLISRVVPFPAYSKERADVRPNELGDADANLSSLLNSVSRYILLPLLLVFLVNLLQPCLLRLRHRGLQAFLNIIH